MKKRKYTFEQFNTEYNFIHYEPVYNTKTGKKGIRYVTPEPFTDEEKKAFKAYSNVVVSECYIKYAPEIKHGSIIILK